MNQTGWRLQTVADTTMDYLTSHRRDIVFALLTLIPAAVWMILIFNKLPVSSEGWYVTYGEMILSGMVPYRDFELVFPPLYTYMMTGYLAVFGGSLISFRILGVVLYLALTAIIYLIFRQVSSPWIASVCTVLSVFIMQSEVVFVAYDYIRFYDLFNYLGILILVRLIVRRMRGEPVNTERQLFLAGIMFGLSILMRQTSGILVVVYTIIFLLLMHFCVKKADIQPRQLITFVIGVAIPVVITFVALAAAGALGPFIDMTMNAGSKGSFADMLFKWIPGIYSDKVRTLIAVIISAGLAFALWKGYSYDRKQETSYERILCIAFVSAAALVVLILFFNYDISASIGTVQSRWLNPVFVINLILAAILLIMIARKHRNGEEPTWQEVTGLMLCGFVFAIGYGSGTSGGLSLGEGALSFGLVAMFILGLSENIPRPDAQAIAKAGVLILCIALVSTSVATKVVTPYSWWGLQTDDYDEAYCETDIPYFAGMKLSPDEKYAYEQFVELSGSVLSEDDQMYCYSQIPIFYSLAGKIPTVKAPVAWFDVARDQTVLDDLEYLKENNPKLIVFEDHGEYVMREHEKMFRGGEECGQRQVYEWLLSIVDGTYGDYTVYEYTLDHCTFYYMVRND